MRQHDIIIWSNYSHLTRPGAPKGSSGSEISLFEGNPGGEILFHLGQSYNANIHPRKQMNIRTPPPPQKNEGLEGWMLF